MAVEDAVKWYTPQAGEPRTGFLNGEDLTNAMTQAYEDLTNEEPGEPLPHAASHAEDGTDPISPESIGAATENHNHQINNVIGLGTVVTRDVPPVGDASSSQVVKGNDTRLSDTRDPKAHTHAPTDITGTAVVDNDARLSDTRDPKAHTHSESDVTGLSLALAGKADLTNGVIPTSQIPALAISDTWVVGSEVAMLALSAQRGDFAVRSDLNKTFVLSEDTPGTLSSWVQIAAGGDVISVNDQTGVVVLGADDVGADAAGSAAAAYSAAVSTASADATSKANAAQAASAPAAHTHPAEGATIQTYTYTTTVPLITGEYEVGLFEGCRSFVITHVETSSAARVRVYSSVAARDADLSRGITEDLGWDHGVILDAVSVAEHLSWTVTPGAFGRCITADVPITVTNLGAEAQITVTITALKLES